MQRYWSSKEGMRRGERARLATTIRSGAGNYSHAARRVGGDKRGLLALTIELEEQVKELTAELRATHEELKRTNSELLQLTLELDDHAAANSKVPR
jgi:hypothetical protein